MPLLVVVVAGDEGSGASVALPWDAAWRCICRVGGIEAEANALTLRNHRRRMADDFVPYTRELEDRFE